MRIALACARCRNSKVKCVHEGEPPCHGCIRNGRTETCVLTTPTTARKDGTTVHGVKRGAPIQATNLRKSARTTQPDVSDIDSVLSYPGLGTIPNMLKILRRKYPHLGFLHPSQNDKTSIGELTLLAIVILISRFIPGLPPGFDERCATILRKELLLQLVYPPNIKIIQALVVTSLFEWGQGVGYRAWMWIGMAVRMAQSLVAMRAEIPYFKRSAAVATPLGDEACERENRTIWSCFVVDKFMSCGSRRPATMTIEGLGIPLPLGEQDYAFGSRPTARHTYKDVRDSPSLQKAYGTVEHHFYGLCCGIDVWSKIYGWVADGGRTIPGMVDPENAPWMEDSCWNGLRKELLDWRDSQEDRMKYPQAKVAVHAVFGHAEVFALINLTYYLSIIFLRREYIPFLPVAETAPRGPIDPPLLTAVAPAGWWDDNAAELFDAAAQITNITEELLLANAPLMMPYAGFCNYTAAAMNLYITAFPDLNHGRSTNAASLADRNISYLRELQSVWKIADEWVSVISHVRSLFQRVASNKTEFNGKSRQDYAHLENSMTRFGTLEPPNAASPSAQDDDGMPGTQPFQNQGRQAHLEPAAALVELSGAEPVLPEADPSMQLYDCGHHPWSLDLMSLNAFDWITTAELPTASNSMASNVGFGPPI